MGYMERGSPTRALLTAPSLLTPLSRKTSWVGLVAPRLDAQGPMGVLIPALESEEEYSDDDDMSWKVRRAAAKCLAALIDSRPDLLPDFHCALAPALIHRFKEREENVKADVFGAYIVLLRQTRPPKGWLEVMEEPTQASSNLQMLRGQVCLPAPPPRPHLTALPPPTAPHLFTRQSVCTEHLLCAWPFV